MKTRNVVLILTVIIVIFQSCLPSLHPLYTENTIVLNDDILGTWIDGDSDYENIVFLEDGTPALADSSRKEKYGVSSVFKFEKADDNSYKLIHYDDDGIEAKFDIYVVKLGENYYLDFYPITEFQDPKNDFNFDYKKFNAFEAWHYYPVHTFAKLTFKDGKMNIALFDTEYLGKLIKENRVRIKYENTEYGIIFTAGTKQLQEFVLKYGNDEKLYMETSDLVKSS